MLTNSIIRHFPEIRFTVIAHHYGHYVEFEVYTIEGTDDKENILWHRKDAETWPDPVESLDDAEIYLHGSVKWDGCSNWHFDEQDRVMLHGCSREDLENIGKILTTCWDIAKELIKNFNQ